MAPNISIEIRSQIIGMHRSGLSVYRISERLGVSERTVNRWVNYWLQTGNIHCVRDHRINNRRPKKTTVETDNLIVNTLREQPFLAVSHVSAVAELPDQISAYTVRRRATEAGLHCRKPAEKISMNQGHAEVRLGFGFQYLMYTIDWNNVVFSDEKVFSSAEDSRKLVWRPLITRYDPRYILQDNHSGRISAACWGWMSSEGVGDIVEIHPRLNVNQYVNILETVMLPSVRRRFPVENHPFINFVQDNSLVHTSSITRK